MLEPDSVVLYFGTLVGHVERHAETLCGIKPFTDHRMRLQSNEWAETLKQSLLHTISSQGPGGPQSGVLCDY